MKVKDLIILIFSVIILYYFIDSLSYRDRTDSLNTQINILREENSAFEIEIERLQEEITDYDDNVSELLNERKKLVDSYDSIIDNIEKYDKKRFRSADINVDSLRSFLSDYKY